jgi:glycosyltransferase involved in cell wall biosynthesis
MALTIPIDASDTLSISYLQTKRKWEGRVRILQWAFPHHPPLGGKEIFTERLASELRKRGHDLLLVADSLHEDSDLHSVQSLADGIEIHRLNLSSFGRHIPGTSDSQNLRGAIKEVVDNFNPDVIQYHNFYSKSLVFLGAYLRSSARHIPMVYTLHDVESISKIPPALGGEIIGHLTDVIVSPSNYIYNRFRAIDSFSTKRTEVIHNGVPLIEIQEKKNEQQVLAAASFENHKGLVILLTAWEKIHTAFPHVKLILAGDGRERDFLLGYAQKLGISESVVFRGWLSESQLRHEFSKDTIVVAPSLIAEAFGLIAAEAQMAGLPVIASDIGGLKEVVEHNVSGYLVPTGSAVALAEALTTLLSSKVMRTEMGNAGRERALANFTLGDCARKYEALFQDLLLREKSAT